MFKSWGFGVEYITLWHASVFGSYGVVPQLADRVPTEPDLEGGSAWRVGAGYYFFQKLPLHLGLSASYGTAFYDHEAKPTCNDGSTTVGCDALRKIILTQGWSFDANIVYLSNSWYYLNLNVGMAYNGKAEPGSSTNPSKALDPINNVPFDLTEKDGGIAAWNPVIGLTVGFAFWEFFPDPTEIRRRERERARGDLGLW